jgi:hypothetical protein
MPTSRRRVADWSLPGRGNNSAGLRVLAIHGQGQRDYSWGVRAWWEFGWCWSSARLTDGTRVHAVDARVPGLDLAFGYGQDPAGSLVVVTSAEVSEHLGPEGFPTRAIAILNGGLLESTSIPLASVRCSSYRPIVEPPASLALWLVSRSGGVEQDWFGSSGTGRNQSDEQGSSDQHESTGCRRRSYVHPELSKKSPRCLLSSG